MKKDLENHLENAVVNEVINCGEAELLDTVTYEQDGVMVTEELLGLRDPEGRVSTIVIRHTAGSRTLDVTFSASGYGSSVWCAYRVGSKESLAGGGFNHSFNSARYANDVERRFSSVSVAWPPKPAGSTDNHYYYF